MKKLLIAVLLSTVCISGFANEYKKELEAKLGKAKMAQIERQAQNELIQFAKQKNAQLPAHVDDVTIMQSIFVENKALIYSYRMQGIHVSKLSKAQLSTLKQEVQKEAVQDMCHNITVSKDVGIGLAQILILGYEFKHMYRDDDNKLLFVVSVNINDVKKVC